MSKINQQTLITYLQEVVPMMQDSSDPESTLLKYAHDKNMPPSVMERLGHTFNSLKINSTLDNSKTASERGRFVPTLDVPALLEKYTDIAKDLDFSKISNKSSSNWWDDIGDGYSVTLKTASSTVKIGNVNDLCWKEDKEEVTFNEPLEKTASAITDDDSGKEELTPDDLVEYHNKFAKESQLFMDIIQNATREKDAIVKKFASLYSGYTASGYPEFDKLEHGCVLNYEGKDQNVFKESIDCLVDEIKTYPYAEQHIKRASEDLYKKYVIAQRPELMDDVVRYHELRVESQAALAMYKEASENAEFANNVLFKKSSAMPTAQQLKDFMQQRDDLARDIGKIAPQLTYDALVRAYNAQKDRDERKDKEHRAELEALARKGEEYAKKQKEQEAAEITALGNKLEGIARTARGAGEALINIPMTALQGASNTMDALRKAVTDAPEATSNKNLEILSDINRVKADTILQEIMWTDPILSKLDEDSIDNVLETYDSIVKVSPEVAMNKGALRSILRRAVEAQGIDMSALKTLGDIQKNVQFKE